MPRLASSNPTPAKPASKDSRNFLGDTARSTRSVRGRTSNADIVGSTSFSAERNDATSEEAGRVERTMRSDDTPPPRA